MLCNIEQITVDSQCPVLSVKVQQSTCIVQITVALLYAALQVIKIQNSDVLCDIFCSPLFCNGMSSVEW